MNWAALYAILSKKIDDISALQMKKVTELPETGETNTLYLVPKTTAEEGNYSDEYIWDADLEEFEKIGDTLINDSPLVIFLCEYKNGYHLKDGFNGADIVNAITNGKYVVIITPAKAYRIFFFLQYEYNWAYFISFNSQPSMSYGNITFYRIYNSSAHEYLSEYEYSFLMTPPSLADENKILKANSNKGAAWADMPNIATSYSSSSTYDLGDLCLYHNLLYECTTAITTAEAWTAAHWTQVNISDELDKKANLTDIPADYTKDTAVTALYDNTATYELGDICMYQKELYECTTAIPVAEEWDSTHWTKTDIFSKMSSGGSCNVEIFTYSNASSTGFYILDNNKTISDIKTVLDNGKVPLLLGPKGPIIVRADTINTSDVSMLGLGSIANGAFYLSGYSFTEPSKFTNNYSGNLINFPKPLSNNKYRVLYSNGSSYAVGDDLFVNYIGIDTYKTNSTYNIGDVVKKDAYYYKCNTNGTTGTWNSSKWDAVTVIDIIDSKISNAVTSVLNTSF